ncbi:MAG: hypothetical protein JWO82_1736 [Akkermansiaceae bacterium]|nr:hypothetical protein [Akkermansiaceae bacterium]
MVTGSFDQRVKACLLKACRPLAILLTVFFGVSFLPGEFEGLYDADWSTCGCIGVDEYYEFRNGMMNYHAYEGYPHEKPLSSLYGNYVRSSDGSVEIRFSAERQGEEGKLFARAYPHFLVTRFVTVEDNKSRWKWKVPVMPKLRRWLEQQTMLEVIAVEGGARRVIYDHEGNIVEEKFVARKPKPAPPEPVKSRAGRRY